MFKTPEFAIDRCGYYFGMSLLSIIQQDSVYSIEFLLAILNSRFAEDWFNTYGKKGGVGVDIGVNKLREFPLPDLSDANILLLSKKVEDLVRKIIDNKKQGIDTKEIELQIEQLVMKLYGITDEENVKKVAGYLFLCVITLIT